MTDQTWVDQVRRLLAAAKTKERAAFEDLDALKSSIDGALRLVVDQRKVANGEPHAMPYPIRRRMLLAQIDRRARWYGLSDEVQAFVWAAGYRVIQELDNDQLDALAGWLSQWIDGMQAGCDSPFAPPAR